MDHIKICHFILPSTINHWAKKEEKKNMIYKTVEYKNYVQLITSGNNVDLYIHYVTSIFFFIWCVCGQSVAQSCRPVPDGSVTVLCWPLERSPGEPSQQIWHLIFGTAMAVPSYLSAQCPRLSRSHRLTRLLLPPYRPLSPTISLCQW